MIKKTIKTILSAGLIGLIISQLFGGGGLFYYLSLLILLWVFKGYKRALGSNQYKSKWRLK